LRLTALIYEHTYDIVLDNVFLYLRDLVEKLHVYLKIEGLNPAGSIKLKAAISMVEDAERKGILRTGGSIVESSSGSLGIALALVSVARPVRRWFHGFRGLRDPAIRAQAARRIADCGNLSGLRRRYARTIYDDGWVAERFGQDCLAPSTLDPTDLSTARR
jgi:hypothetical protein